MDKKPTVLSGEKQKAYFEYYAREVLVSLFPKEFKNLQRADKPDLQDVRKSIGIEVTLALIDNEPNANTPYDNIIDAKNKRDKEKFKESTKENDPDSTSKPLIKAAKRKIDKLNNKGDDTIYEYREYRHYRLFIYTSVFKEKRDFLEEMLLEVLKAQRKCKRKYEVIYVYSEYFGLWYCDLKKKRIGEYPVDDEQRKHFSDRALKRAVCVE